MFPRVSGPELAARLCLHSKQYRVSRASTCFHRTHRYCLHSAPTQTIIIISKTIVVANTLACFHAYRAQSLQPDCVSTTSNTVSILPRHVFIAYSNTVSTDSKYTTTVVRPILRHVSMRIMPKTSTWLLGHDFVYSSDHSRPSRQTP